jgi:hypothetical protein
VDESVSAAGQMRDESGFVTLSGESTSPERSVDLGFSVVPPAGIEPATRGLGNPVSTAVEYD